MNPLGNCSELFSASSWKSVLQEERHEKISTLKWNHRASSSIFLYVCVPISITSFSVLLSNVTCQIVQPPCRCAICQWERAQTHVHIVIICVFGVHVLWPRHKQMLAEGEPPLGHPCDARGIATSWQLWIWTPRRKPWNLGMTKHTEWFEGNVNPWIMIQNPQCCLIAGSTFRINLY